MNRDGGPVGNIMIHALDFISWRFRYDVKKKRANKQCHSACYICLLCGHDLHSDPSPGARPEEPCAVGHLHLAVFLLIAGTVCTLSIMYKGSPNLGLDEKPS